MEHLSDIVASGVGVVVILLQAWNTYQNALVQRNISDLKVYMLEKFVTKQELDARENIINISQRFASASRILEESELINRRK